MKRIELSNHTVKLMIVTGLVLSVAHPPLASADVYNLYFKRADEAKESAGEEPSPPSTAIAAPRPEAHPIPAPATDSSRVVIPPTDGRAPQTIIINNNLSSPLPPPAVDARVAASAPAPPLPPPPPPPEPNVLASPSPPEPEHDPEPLPPLPPRRPSPITAVFGATAFADHGNAIHGGTFDAPSTPASGFTLGLGINITQSLGLYGWGGVARSLRPRAGFHAGLELQFLPFRIDMGSYNLVEFGPLAGVSSLALRESEFGPLHLGGRLNFNFNESLGLTAALRINGSIVMGEAGLIAHL